MVGVSKSYQRRAPQNIPSWSWMESHTARASNYLDARIAYLCGDDADLMLRWAVGESWRYLDGKTWPRRIEYRTGLQVHPNAAIDETLSRIREAWQKYGRFQYRTPIQREVEKRFGVTPPTDL